MARDPFTGVQKYLAPSVELWGWGGALTGGAVFGGSTGVFFVMAMSGLLCSPRDCCIAQHAAISRVVCVLMCTLSQT